MTAQNHQFGWAQSIIAGAQQTLALLQELRSHPSETTAQNLREKWEETWRNFSGYKATFKEGVENADVAEYFRATVPFTAATQAEDLTLRDRIAKAVALMVTDAKCNLHAETLMGKMHDFLRTEDPALTEARRQHSQFRQELDDLKKLPEAPYVKAEKERVQREISRASERINLLEKAAAQRQLPLELALEIVALHQQATDEKLPHRPCRLDELFYNWLDEAWGVVEAHKATNLHEEEIPSLTEESPCSGGPQGQRGKGRQRRRQMQHA